MSGNLSFEEWALAFSSPGHLPHGLGAKESDGNFHFTYGLGLPLRNQFLEFPGGLAVKDLVLLLWLQFNPWNFCMPWVQPRSPQKKQT